MPRELCLPVLHGPLSWLLPNRALEGCGPLSSSQFSAKPAEGLSSHLSKVPGSASLLGPALSGHCLRPHRSEKELGLCICPPEVTTGCGSSRGCGSPSLGASGSSCFGSVPFLSPRPPLATRLLAHKIQSPQEWEAIQALTVRRGERVPSVPRPCGWHLGRPRLRFFGGVPSGSSLEAKGVVPEWPRSGVWATCWGPIASCPSPCTVRPLVGRTPPRIVWPRGSLLQLCAGYILNEGSTPGSLNPSSFSICSQESACL